MNEALMCKQRGLSDEVVLNLIVESANKYKCLECSNTEKVSKYLALFGNFGHTSTTNAHHLAFPSTWLY